MTLAEAQKIVDAFYVAILRENPGADPEGRAYWARTAVEKGWTIGETLGQLMYYASDRIVGQGPVTTGSGASVTQVVDNIITRLSNG